jgi:hypothetical protein
MSKAQSLILQFVLFFMVGFLVFVSIGTFFKYQSDIFQQDVAKKSLDLTSNFFKSAILSQVDTCKGCDEAQYSIRLQNITAGYYMEILMDRLTGLSVKAIPEGKVSNSGIYNLNESFDMSGVGSSVKPINLTFSRTKNVLRVE